MQALKFNNTGSLNNLSLVNVEKPCLRPGEALVRVKAAGVNGVSSKCLYHPVQPNHCISPMQQQSWECFHSSPLRVFLAETSPAK